MKSIFHSNMWRQKQRKVALIKVLVVTTMLLTVPSKRRYWVQPWINRKDKGVLQLVHDELRVEDPEKFRNFLRIDEEAFNKLLALVFPILKKQDKKMRKAISVRDKLTITLRFIATGESYRSLMYAFRIHESTISLFVPEVCQAIYLVLEKKYLKVPDSTEEWLNIAKDFENVWNLPNILGALDGKHIVFRPLKKYGSAFYNYKSSHSIVLLAIVDANYNFRYIDIGCNGRVSDGGVFMNSSLYKALHDENNVLDLPANKALPGRNDPIPYVIVADGAFALSSRVIKPFPLRNMTEEQRIFNYRLSRARRVVENAFGILANRFRVLLNTIPLHQHKVRDIVKTCVVLHNFLRKECPQFARGEETTEGFQLSMRHEGGNRYGDTAKRIREEFMAYVNNEGTVPWQYNLQNTF